MLNSVLIIVVLIQINLEIPEISLGKSTGHYAMNFSSEIRKILKQAQVNLG